MRKSFHYYTSLGITRENMDVYDYIINEIKHGKFNEDHIRLLDNSKALKYIIAEGEYEVFKAIIRVFSYEKDGKIRRRYLVDPFSRDIVEYINSAYDTYSSAIYTVSAKGILTESGEIIENSLIIHQDIKEDLIKAIYESYPKKDVDMNVIGDVLARQISGWGYPIVSEKDVIKYSEISNLYPSLELYRMNIMTTYNDTLGCLDDRNFSGTGYVEIRINYDTLDNENKMYADVLVQKGKAKFVQENNKKDVSLFVYCTPDEYVRDVSSRMSQLLKGFKKQDMIYGRLSSDRVLKEVLSLVEFLDEEDVKQYKELWNNGQYRELFRELELPYYYDPEERQFWLHRNFCDRHKAYINGQRYFDTNAKLEMRRPSES
jgi:hypothetical protein